MENNLRPIFKNIPVFVLMLLVVVVGLPIHLFLGVMLGLKSGIINWYSEWKELWLL